jgi:hypothetical protein
VGDALDGGVILGNECRHRHEYNFWEPPNGTFGTPPYRVRVTDVNGTVLEDTVDLTSGDQEAENQMTCQ